MNWGDCVPELQFQGGRREGSGGTGRGRGAGMHWKGSG
eukprot:CAMPEP_0174304234 /NCGR_PEP_ID=MMETSP0809-20121228/60655_1 /TAXON_ID=73025 ORGANISM="Eutreptiella gymnastica-like, Strain CCMP1594" /NCGR_SAMPLE_ID=MMETSP0809 /ASSEMBLY_ACC=CAM_ASM_000658 /LENGTH=37 /DNA_ID= /DNA_START= /DNA_END= /DNA_ORIENTATION=